MAQEEELRRVLSEAENLRAALERQELSQTDVQRINLERQQVWMGGLKV